jgi:hypothetical protein
MNDRPDRKDRQMDNTPYELGPLLADILPGDLNDLDAILARYSDQETADIRRILAARRAA